MKRTDSNRGRTYTAPDGTELWSVTTKLNVVAKPQLIAWAAKMERELVLEAATDLWKDAPKTLSPASFKLILEQRLGAKKAHQKESERAANIGTLVHDAIERELRISLKQPVGPPPELGPEAALALSKWKEWEKEREFEPLFIEQQVFSLVHGYAGTLDMIARYTRADGKRVLALVDWKTSSGIYAEYLLQIGAYHGAIREMGHFENEELDGLIVKIPKTSGKEEIRIVEIPHAAIVEKYLPGFLRVNALFDVMKGLEGDPFLAAPKKPRKQKAKATNTEVK